MFHIGVLMLYFSVSIFCPEITCRRSIPPLFAMASIVDSEAQFELRMEQVRLPTALRLALKNSGVCTISALAYAYGQLGSTLQLMIFKLGYDSWTQVPP